MDCCLELHLTTVRQDEKCTTSRGREGREPFGKTNGTPELGIARISGGRAGRRSKANGWAVGVVDIVCCW